MDGFSFHCILIVSLGGQDVCGKDKGTGWEKTGRPRLLTDGAARFHFRFTIFDGHHLLLSPMKNDDEGSYFVGSNVAGPVLWAAPTRDSLACKRQKNQFYFVWGL